MTDDTDRELDGDGNVKDLPTFSLDPAVDHGTTDDDGAAEGSESSGIRENAIEAGMDEEEFDRRVQEYLENARRNARKREEADDETD